MAKRKKLDLPITQIHLDFHTPAEVPDVGADFDADRFADPFDRAGVGLVTVFGKCHHGWSYYPTKAGKVHPSLGFDLLGGQIEALKARGIRVPVYLSVGWDEALVAERPGLMAVDREGRPWTGPLKAGWRLVCLNRPDYLDYVAAQAEEVLDAYPADGIFYDILMQPWPACFCPACLRRMADEGVDPADDAQAAAWQRKVIAEACARLAKPLKGRRSDLSVFFNSCFGLEARDLAAYDSHVDVESLPTGGWGYIHFPIVGRFARTLGKTVVGMTARFHHHWGDFGGLKPQAALEQECFHALMLGCRVNIGDHLPPRGLPEPAVYERIGRVLRQVRDREPWCTGAEPIAPIAVLAAEARTESTRTIPPGVAGAARMLMETHHLFDVIDVEADFGRYDVLVLPDRVRLDAPLARKVGAFLKGGGRVLATAWSALADREDHFVLDDWPVTYAGEARHSQPYWLFGKELADGIPDMPHAIYVPGPEVRAKPGSKVLARMGDPYFSRTWEHFYGHGEAALARRTKRPAVAVTQAVAYAQAPLFAAYAETGYTVYRQAVANLLDRLLPERPLRVEMPTTGRATLLRQGPRLVVHLMHYVPERRTDRLDLIEDRLPLYDVPVSVALGRRARRVYLAPQERDLAYEVDDERVAFSVPVVDGHQMIVVE